MISKEEIENAKECLEETIQNTYAEGKVIKLNNLAKYIQQLESKQQKVIDLIFQYGQIDGEHHKTWVIDQVVRILLEEQYDKWVKEYEEDDYTWEIGIAP